MNDIIDKINNYLQVGGLFNPELMEHHKVSDLLLECRNLLETQNKRKSTLPQVDLDVIMDAYAFTVADDGVVWGLTAGDMGYENTGITIPVEDLQAWAKYNYKSENEEATLAANRDLMLHWEVLRADYDVLLEKHNRLIFYLAHIDLDNTTEHDAALLESAVEEAKKEYFAGDNV